MAKYHNIISDRKEINKVLRTLQSTINDNEFNKDGSQLNLITNKKHQILY